MILPLLLQLAIATTTPIIPQMLNDESSMAIAVDVVGAFKVYCSKELQKQLISQGKVTGKTYFEIGGVRYSCKRMDRLKK